MEAAAPRYGKQILDQLAHGAAAAVAISGVKYLLGVWSLPMCAWIALCLWATREVTEWQNGGSVPWSRGSLIDLCGWVILAVMFGEWIS